MYQTMGTIPTRMAMPATNRALYCRGVASSSRVLLSARAFQLKNASTMARKLPTVANRKSRE